MTNNSNPFSLACRHLLSKYTISTLQSTNIADNQIIADTYRNLPGFQVQDQHNASYFPKCPANHWLADAKLINYSDAGGIFLQQIIDIHDIRTIIK